MNQETNESMTFMNTNINEDFNPIKILIIGALLFTLAMIPLIRSSSVNACLKKDKAGAFFIASAFCVLFLTIFFTLRKTIHPPIVLVVLIFAVIAIACGSYLYQTCYNINNQISEQLKNNSQIIKLNKKYSNVVNPIPLADCINYHSGTFYTSKDLVCRNISNCPNSAGIVCDDKKGAKLVDFYVSSSHQTCHVPMSSEHFVSTEMIKIVLKGGARLLDFNIYSETFKDGIKPVVKSEVDNIISSNFILLEDVFETILSYGFHQPVSDPLLIHLNLKTNNVEVIDIIANLYVQTFGQYLLEPRFSYLANQSMATQPICNYINKVILIVSGETSHTYLDELINLHTSKNARLLSAKNVSNPVEPETFAFSNEQYFTLMKPHNHKNNTNPSSAYTHGVQAPLMNFWNVDRLMKNYLDFFSKGSFVMKNFDLQRDRTDDITITSTKEYSDTNVLIDS